MQYRLVRLDLRLRLRLQLRLRRAFRCAGTSSAGSHKCASAVPLAQNYYRKFRRKYLLIEH